MQANSSSDSRAGRTAESPATPAVDLLVVGGGVNGTGIARDAAGRGLSVVLCEKDDLAQGTSSRSSRLIHGGLRYLEHGEFGLVREALRERETLLRVAPHLVQPLRFVLPHVPRMRPAWMLRLALVLYDNLAHRDQLPGSHKLRFDSVPEGEAVRPDIRHGFAYWDCRTDDARLVVHNALGAHELGARILTRHELVAARRCNGLWHVQLRDCRTGTTGELAVRALVNAAGPWVDTLAGRLAESKPARRVRLIKGSHIVVRHFWNGDHGFLLQNTDRRVVFVTPYEPGFALIGTTDVDYCGAPEAVTACADEISYLCDAVNRQLRCSLSAADVVYSYAGVRSLVSDAQDNPAAVTRDYVLDLAQLPSHTDAAAVPLLTVLGGKITTFRRLAEQAVEMLRPVFPQMGPAWTARTPLPGGEHHGADAAGTQAHLLTQAHFLPAEHALGLFSRHGSRAGRVLAGARTAEELGRHFGAGLYEAEARHFIANEWAMSTEDVLWRRSKFGLRLDTEQLAQFARWMDSAV